MKPLQERKEMQVINGEPCYILTPEEYEEYEELKLLKQLNEDLEKIERGELETYPIETLWDNVKLK